jgi:hypothetical protein
MRDWLRHSHSMLTTFSTCETLHATTIPRQDWNEHCRDRSRCRRLRRIALVIAATVKLNPRDVSRHQGLRVAIHPQGGGYDRPCEEDGLIRIPLPYDFSFMEYFREAIDVVRALLKSSPDLVIDSAARHVVRKLQPLRQRPVREIISYLRETDADRRLLKTPIIVPTQRVIIGLDTIRRFLPGLFPEPAVDQIDASDSSRSIGPVPLVLAA